MRSLRVAACAAGVPLRGLGRILPLGSWAVRFQRGPSALMIAGRRFASKAASASVSAIMRISKFVHPYQDNAQHCFGM